MEKRMSGVNGKRADFSGCKDEKENPENEESDFSPKTVKRERGFFFAKTPKNLPHGCFQK